MDARGVAHSCLEVERESKKGARRSAVRDPFKTGGEGNGEGVPVGASAWRMEKKGEKGGLAW
jgi:hypothetical protein